MTVLNIAKTLASTASTLDYPKYEGTAFEHIPYLHSRTKGKLFETMVSEILEAEGHEVFNSTNQQHDLRVRFSGETHRTKLEIKGAMLRRADDKFYTGAFVLSHDFDEIFLFFLYPNNVQGWRVNRSVLRGMEKDGVMKQGKDAWLFADLSEEVMNDYDCVRVF